MSGPDKPKVIGEEWSDERVKSFLAIEPANPGVDADFLVLQKAYQAMRAGDFERFIGFFVAAGRNLDAVGESGETILDHILNHRRSTAYAQALTAAGARTRAEAGS